MDGAIVTNRDQTIVAIISFSFAAHRLGTNKVAQCFCRGHTAAVFSAVLPVTLLLRLRCIYAVQPDLCIADPDSVPINDTGLSLKRFGGLLLAMLFTSIAIVVFGGLIATKIFAQVLLVPSLLLMPMIVSLTFIGTFTFKNEIFNVYFMLGFGVLGYLLNRLSLPVAPIVIGLILGDKAQEALRTTLQLSHGDFGILFTRPISLTIFILIVLVLIYPVWKTLKAKRQVTGLS